MLSQRLLLAFALVFVPFFAHAGDDKAARADSHGDPLPQGAIARLGTVRFRHSSPIVFAAFLSGGKGVLSVSDDGVVCTWEFPSGKQLHRFDALAKSSSKVTSATLSPDSKHLTAFCDDGFMRILDCNNGKELGKVASSSANPPANASNPPFGSSALVKSLLARSTPTLGPVYSPDAKTLMLVASSRAMQFVDLQVGKEIGPGVGHTDQLTAIGFSADGKHLFTKDSRFSHQWSVAGKDLGAVKLPQKLGSPTEISPDGRFGVSLARFATPAAARAAKSREALLFDATTGKEIERIAIEVDLAPIHRRPVLFSPDSRWLAINSGDDKELVHIYEVPSGKLLRTLDAGPANAGGKAPFKKGGGWGSAGAEAMVFAADGKMLAFQAGAGASIQVFDTDSGKKLASLLSPDISNSILQGVFSADGRSLVLERSDGSVALVELATGQTRRVFGSDKPARLDAQEDFMSDVLFGPARQARIKPAVAISPDGKLLAHAGPGYAVHVVHALSGKELAVFKGHTLPVSALAFSPDGKTLASASDDTTALIWDVSKVDRTVRHTEALKDGELEKHWQALAEDDAAKALSAIGALIGSPKDAVTWIKDRVKAAPVVDEKRIDDLMRQLDDQEFKAREKATAELLRIGEHVLPALDKALKAQPSLEVQRRLEDIQTKITGITLQGERLRIFRAVEILEHIGTPDSRRTLEALAEGAPGSLATTSARAALKR